MTIYAQRKEYLKKWRKEHPDKIRKYNKQYRDKLGEEHTAYMKKWRKDHPEKVAEYNIRYWGKQLAKQHDEHKGGDTANGKTED